MTWEITPQDFGQMKIINDKQCTSRIHADHTT